MPATAHQIEQGLGVEKLMALAPSGGLTPEVVKAKLVKLLPQVIDTLTRDGVLPTRPHPR